MKNFDSGALAAILKHAIKIFHKTAADDDVWLDKRKVSKVKLATVVEGDQKAPFLMATTPSCRGGHYSFPWIAPLYPWCILYIAEC